jgi:alanyl-tRNA synthetase
MKNLGLNEIRKLFLDFFESKGHTVESSYSLVPQNDKSLLLINAGMAPLKNYFTGAEVPPNVRMATCQKCIRTGDIENIGHTARHATFFEMLGNFSFGEYFKEESLVWGWEFITEWLEMDPNLLWGTVYHEDDEAYDIWRDVIKMPEERIVRLGKKDNFWEIGTGPCGPCSEVYFDRGPAYGCGAPDCKPGCDCDRYLEFWNHVFTQYNRDENGEYHLLDKKNIDTGMGLERIACILQEVDSIFDVDTIKAILTRVETVSGKKFGVTKANDVSIRIITDHIRAVTFMVSDGILPNNEGRGYVLRRLLRRAARHGKLLGISGSFLADLSNTVVELSKEAYPDLEKRHDYIRKIIEIEEERFQQTLDQGLSILQADIAAMEAKGESILAGDKAFRLYDTYGFPLDLTNEILQEKGLTTDEDGFLREMELQRERARSARGGADELGWEGDALSGLPAEITSTFVGYDTLEISSEVIAMATEQGLADGLSHATAPLKARIVLKSTPFYPEGGGQVGDKGTLFSDTAIFNVHDTKKGTGGMIIHVGELVQGEIKVGQTLTAKVDQDTRLDTARNHTATHLLHKALKSVLGAHVEQAGSLVDPHKLRFDFTHFQHLTPEEVKAVEDQVNAQIFAPHVIETFNTSIKEAKDMGATALFGEKYGDTVRVVKAGDYSLELCGGTHLDNTAKISALKITSEGGVAAGVRRIEAATGRNFYALYKKLENQVEKTSEVLKTPQHDLIKRAENLMEENRALQKELQEMKNKMAAGSIDDLIQNAKNIKGMNLVAAKIDGADSDMLKDIGDRLKDRLENAVVVLGTASADKALFIVMCAPGAIALGAHAGSIIKEVAKVAGGGGGGTPHMAQAGGKDPSKVEAAVKKAIEVLEG